MDERVNGEQTGIYIRKHSAIGFRENINYTRRLWVDVGLQKTTWITERLSPIRVVVAVRYSGCNLEKGARKRRPRVIARLSAVDFTVVGRCFGYN